MLTPPAGLMPLKSIRLSRLTIMSRHGGITEAAEAGSTGAQLLRLSEFGERAGIRTLDLLIKSQLLYRLSYALPKAEAASKLRRNIGRVPVPVNRKKGVVQSRLPEAAAE